MATSRDQALRFDRATDGAPSAGAFPMERRDYSPCPAPAITSQAAEVAPTNPTKRLRQCAEDTSTEASKSHRQHVKNPWFSGKSGHAIGQPKTPISIHRHSQIAIAEIKVPKTRVDGNRAMPHFVHYRMGLIICSVEQSLACFAGAHRRRLATGVCRVRGPTLTSVELRRSLASATAAENCDEGGHGETLLRLYA